MKGNNRAIRVSLSVFLALKSRGEEWESFDGTLRRLLGLPIIRFKPKAKRVPRETQHEGLVAVFMRLQPGQVSLVKWTGTPDALTGLYSDKDTARVSVAVLRACQALEPLGYSFIRTPSALHLEVARV